MSNSSSEDSARDEFLENITSFTIHDLCKNKRRTLRWLQHINLLATSQKCDKCQGDMTLISVEENIDGFTWCCYGMRKWAKSKATKACHTTKSVRNGSFFANSELSFRQILLIVYYFVFHARPNHFICAQLGLSEKNIFDLHMLCCQAAYNAMLRKSQCVGGEGKYVELDESKFEIRHNRAGVYRNKFEEQWVLGGFERGSGKYFLVPIEKRDFATSVPIIESWVLPETTISANHWRYKRSLDQECLEKLELKHSIRFKDCPLSSKTKGSFSRAKSDMSRKDRNGSLCAKYLAMYMFTSWAKKENKQIFLAFLEEVARFYNPMLGGPLDLDAPGPSHRE